MHCCTFYPNARSPLFVFLGVSWFSKIYYDNVDGELADICCSSLEDPDVSPDSCARPYVNNIEVHKQNRGST